MAVAENNVPPVTPFSGGGSSVAPPPPAPPAATIPPLKDMQTVSAANSPPTAPVQTTPPDSATGQTSAVAPKRKGLPKKLLLIVLLVILGLGGLFVALRFIMPRLGGGRMSGEIVWWGLWEDSSIVESLISEFEEMHSGVTVKYVKQSKQDYRERLTNALAKGEGPDVFRMHNTWVPMFVDFLDTAPADVMTQSEFSSAFYPVAREDLVVGSEILGIPLEYEGLGLFINEEIFTTQGEIAPKTWDELRETAINLTVYDSGGRIEQAGVALGRTQNVDHWEDILALLMIQNGVNLNNPIGTAAEEALQYFVVFSNEDRVWDETQPPSTAAFAAGKLAMYFGPSWRAFEIQEQNPSLKFKVVGVPQLLTDITTSPEIGYASYWVEAVNAESKNSAAAWEFLKFLSTEESLEKLYLNASKSRGFGEPYPLVSMRSKLLGDSIVSGLMATAPNAKSWYLASRTFDGATGINSQMSKYFEDAVNAVVARNSGNAAKSALETAALGVNQVLVQYGLAAPPPVEE